MQKKVSNLTLGCWIAVEHLVQTNFTSLFRSTSFTHKNKGFTLNNPKMNQNYCDSQLFLGKNLFFLEKAVLWE